MCFTKKKGRTRGWRNEVIDRNFTSCQPHMVVAVVVVIGFECPDSHTGSHQDSQTQVIRKYTFLNTFAHGHVREISVMYI